MNARPMHSTTCLALLLLTTAPANCRAQGEPYGGPTVEELSAQMSKAHYLDSETPIVPSGWVVDEFRIGAFKNIGDDVDPHWRAKFSATLRLETDLFLVVQTLPKLDESGDGRAALIVRRARAAGTQHRLDGKFDATQPASKWSVAFTLDLSARVANPKGVRTRKSFGDATVLIEGSEEAKRLRNRHAERRRILSEAAAKREALERKLSAERIAAAEEQRAKDDLRFRDEAAKRMLESDWLQEGDFPTRLVFHTWNAESRELTGFALKHHIEGYSLYDLSATFDPKDARKLEMQSTLRESSVVGYVPSKPAVSATALMDRKLTRITSRANVAWDHSVGMDLRPAPRRHQLDEKGLVAFRARFVHKWTGQLQWETPPMDPSPLEIEIVGIDSKTGLVSGSANIRSGTQLVHRQLYGFATADGVELFHGNAIAVKTRGNWPGFQYVLKPSSETSLGGTWTNSRRNRRAHGKVVLTRTK